MATRHDTTIAADTERVNSELEAKRLDNAKLEARIERLRERAGELETSLNGGRKGGRELMITGLARLPQYNQHVVEVVEAGSWPAPFRYVGDAAPVPGLAEIEARGPLPPGTRVVVTGGGLAATGWLLAVGGALDPTGWTGP